jgi:molecular chaperone DnaJ
VDDGVLGPLGLEVVTGLGEGEAGPGGGPPGDLYVFIQVEPHEFFERHDTDVLSRIPISFVQAALGDSIEIPTLIGKKMIDIKKGTQHGDILRLRGEGIPSLRNGSRGSQIVQFSIRIPTHLNKKQEELLREFAKVETGKLSSKIKNILRGDRLGAV